jgi:hypothetical protein
MGQIKVGTHRAKVDVEDVPILRQYSWQLHPGSGGTQYARSCSKGRYVYMHRLILGVQNEPKKFVDHINHDGLDNRKCNLRVCTRQQNLWNKRWCRQAKASSKYKGVVVVGKPFRATITVNYKPIFLGAFATEREAALAYNAAAIKYYGEYARLNHVENTSVQAPTRGSRSRKK